ncbi:hypothetical protein [Streptomyces sp. NPDC018833]|uniref:hypothetical protein n=1 Tax=Streptomyces sp. NPDC018833 TaxID=3365053 RepID=UPI0037A5728C
MRAGLEAAQHLADGLPASRVLSFEDPACWAALDHGVRHSAWYDPMAAARLSACPETALCHPDGRVREAALRAGLDAPAFWYLVVVRCADWAEAVRECARRLLDERLTAATEDTLRTLTPLVLRVGRREQGTWARNRFEAALRTPPYPALAGLRDSRDTATRRLAARITLDEGLLGVRELARRAADDLDPVSARWWSDAALAALANGAECGESVDILLSARAPLVRSAGVTALRRAGRAAEAAAHLLDRSPLVRACARWLVSQGGGDPHARYLELCADPTGIAPYAMTGLAECGRREDAGLLRTFLTHPVAAVRAQATAGLRLLDAVPADRVLPLVDDPSAAVVREATRALLPLARRFPADPLFERLAPERPVHTRRAAFRLLKEHGGLTELRAAVAALTDPDPALRQNGAACVQERRWVDTLQPVDPGVRAELEAMLHQCTPLFSDFVMTGLRGRLGLRS